MHILTYDPPSLHPSLHSSLPSSHPLSIVPTSLLSTLFSTTNMAAKSDGTAVPLENDVPPLCARSPVLSTPRARYSLLDCCWTLAALLVFFSDGASDLWLAADYYLRRDYRWFVLTLVFVVVPSLVVQVLSFRWFAYDYTESSSAGSAAAAVVAASGAQRRFSTAESSARTRCCRACSWLFHSIVHILQLAQVWR